MLCLQEGPCPPLPSQGCLQVCMAVNMGEPLMSIEENFIFTWISILLLQKWYLGKVGGIFQEFFYNKKEWMVLSYGKSSNQGPQACYANASCLSICPTPTAWLFSSWTQGLYMQSWLSWNSICRSGWLQIHTDFPASVSQAQRLTVYTATSDPADYFLKNILCFEFKA